MAANYRQILEDLLSERNKLDAAISAIQALIDGTPAKRRGRPPKNASVTAQVTDKRRQPWSEERRLKMSQAQKKRFAAAKKAAKA